jgi:hypothetical protein
VASSALVWIAEHPQAQIKNLAAVILEELRELGRQ